MIHYPIDGFIGRGSRKYCPLECHGHQGEEFPEQETGKEHESELKVKGN